VNSFKEKQMSRVGKKPIPIPDKVKASLESNLISIEGPKGKLQHQVHHRIKVEIKDKEIIISRSSNLKLDRSLHGLIRSLINNMIIGVTAGYTKELEIHGVGFRAKVQSKKLNLQLGFSHPIDYQIPEGITIETPKPTEIIVKGIDKQKVGEVSAKIRDFYKPEPYKGKGIRYKGEKVRRKAGKAVV
jgi:large subunit ribosomal protein L6